MQIAADCEKKAFNELLVARKNVDSSQSLYTGFFPFQSAICC